MQTLVMLLLLAIFSLSVWAAPSKHLECELSALAGYDQLITMLVRERLVTADELKELLAQDKPTNPYGKRERSEQNLAIRQAFDREMRVKLTRDEWPATQKKISQLLEVTLHGASQVKNAKEETHSIFLPKIYDRIPFHQNGGMGMLFNPDRGELFGWEKNSAESKAFIYNLRTKTTTPFSFQGDIRSAVVRADGSVWVVVDRDSHITIHSLDDPHGVRFSDSGVRQAQLTLFETPRGELLLARTSRTHLRVEKIPTRQTLLSELHNSQYPAKFIATIGGEVFMAVATEATRLVYQLEGESMRLVGRVPRGTEFSMGDIDLSSDGDGNPVIGILRVNHQQVLKFVNGQADLMGDLTNQSLDSASASMRLNAKSELILVAGSKSDKSEINIINLSNSNVPAVKFNVSQSLSKATSWVTLPDGQEVFAALYADAPTQIFSPAGSVLATLERSTGSGLASPVWWKTTDGQVFLAVNTPSEVLIYSVWHKTP